jgi:hypothetical protein
VYGTANPSASSYSYKRVFPSYFTILQPFAKLFSVETSFSLSKSFATHLSLLACFYSNHFSQYDFLRVVFFRVSVKSVPYAEAFVNPDNPVLKYLDFLLPLIEPAVDRLRLSVTHLLIQRVYPCIPRSCFFLNLYILWVTMIGISQTVV